MKQLVVSRPGIRLHLIGDGDMRAPLKARVAAEGLSRAIIFEGAVGHDRLPAWYRGADAVVLSSHSEGLPNVLRESLACGTPFVTTDVGDVGEIARPEFSRLVAPGDLEGFVAAVGAVLEPRFRQSAGSYVARTWEDCAQEYSDLLEELVGSRAAA